MNKNEKKENKNFNLNIDDLYFRYNTIANWIKVADNKASIALAIVGLVSSSLIGISINNIRCSVSSTIKTVAIVSIVISIILLVITVLACLNVFTPRLFKFKNEEEESNFSTIFYDDIIKFGNCETYCEKLKNSSDEEYKKQLIENIYNNSKICSDKMKYMCHATRLMIVTIVIAALSLILSMFC